jgi:hypothetical protein
MPLGEIKERDENVGLDAYEGEAKGKVNGGSGVGKKDVKGKVVAGGAMKLPLSRQSVNK